MIKFLSSFKLNEIHIVDSLFNKDFNFREKTAGKFRESGQEQGHLLLCKSGSGEFQKSISAPTPWYQNPCDASIFRPNFRKNEKGPKFDLSLESFPPKM